MPRAPLPIPHARAAKPPYLRELVEDGAHHVEGDGGRGDGGECEEAVGSGAGRRVERQATGWPWDVDERDRRALGARKGLAAC